MWSKLISKEIFFCIQSGILLDDFPQLQDCEGIFRLFFQWKAAVKLGELPLIGKHFHFLSNNLHMFFKIIADEPKTISEYYRRFFLPQK